MLTPIHRITVLVVAYHSDRWLRGCIESLTATWDPRDQLLVVDNGGNNELDSIAAAAPHVRIVKTPRSFGFAEANNFGLVQGGLAGEAVCFLNQDTVSHPGWLDACVKCLNEDPQIGAVSPLLTKADDTTWDIGFAYCVRHLNGFPDARPAGTLNAVFDVDLLTAAALVVRTEVLRRIGPFDPVFGSYYEDFDLCRRVREAGYKLVICGPGVVRHYGGSATTSPAAERKRTRQLLRNRLIHRLRCAGPDRWKHLCRYLGIEMPHTLGRCLARTKSAPQLSAFLQAQGDLIPLLSRLISQARDREAFESYLIKLGWRDGAPAERPLSA